MLLPWFQKWGRDPRFVVMLGGRNGTVEFLGVGFSVSVL